MLTFSWLFTLCAVGHVRFFIGDDALRERLLTVCESLEETGCGLVVNTSFNMRGEPIDCTPNSEVKFLTGDG